MDSSVINLLKSERDDKFKKNKVWIRQHNLH